MSHNLGQAYFLNLKYTIHTYKWHHLICHSYKNTPKYHVYSVKIQHTDFKTLQGATLVGRLWLRQPSTMWCIIPVWNQRGWAVQGNKGCWTGVLSCRFELTAPALPGWHQPGDPQGTSSLHSTWKKHEKKKKKREQHHRSVPPTRTPAVFERLTNQVFYLGLF